MTSPEETPAHDLRHAPITSGVRVRNLSIAFGREQPVLHGLNFEVVPGEIVALVGASGCGKSTLLRSIARLTVPQLGQISFVPATQSHRVGDLSYVFQDPTLLPWRTVYENVRLPLELGQKDLAARPDFRVVSALDSVGLAAETWRKFPRELSGGMRMRTSIARALVTDPNVLLLDEPFAALDDLLRSRLNDLILELWTHRLRTILFVTHNIAEAVYLSHRIAVLGGRAVARNIDNELAWPRTPAIRTSIEFARMYGEVSRTLAEVSN